MTDNLLKSVQSLRKMAPQLNAATDEATGIVRRVEKFLNDECSIGIPALAGLPYKSERVKFEDQDDAEPARHEMSSQLAYVRVDGKFCIAIQRFICDDRGEVRELDSRPWLACPRHEKLESFHQLPDLLGSIACEAEKIALGTTETTKTVARLLSAIEQAGE